MPVVLVLILAVLGCKAPPPEENLSSSAEKLEPPAPSSIVTPLAKASSNFDNKSQAKYLQEQAGDLGIQRFGKAPPSVEDEEREPITYEEGVQRTKEYSQQFAATRREIDRKRPKSVQLSGAKTPRLIAEPARNGEPLKEAESPASN